MKPASTSGVLLGRTPGTSAIVEIRYGASIAGVDELIRPPETDAFVAPGFIDVQVNGFAGVDYNDPDSSHEEIARSVRSMYTTGVTRFFPTVITGAESRMTAALRNLAGAKAEFARSAMPEAQSMAGFHLEGPHISPEAGPRGAHPVEHIRPPDFEEFQRWQEAAGGNVRLVTVSPEYDGAPAYISQVVRTGVAVSIGHTKATSIQIQDAIAAGASMSTHLGNAAHPALPKTQNYIWDQLADDRLTASFIVDGIHIPEAFFRAAVRAKGVERSVLVTDAVMPAMCTPGLFRLGQVEVELHDDGSVRMRGDTRLAGSALRMDHAVANAMRFGRISLHEAIAMATVNPARVARIANRRRGIAAGDGADLVRFEWDEANSCLRVLETIVAGQTVWQI